jgi:small subunit ribosomal protein S2
MITLEQMLDSGVHLGHQVRRWNPKMSPYIYGERNGIHIIDVLQTLICLQQSVTFLETAAKDNKTILFVGTKKQFANIIEVYAKKSGSYYVNQRWLGGMLTNWSTMQTCIQNLELLEKQDSSGFFDSLTKKEASLLIKRQLKLKKYFGGIQEMTKIPDIVIIVGQVRELNAVKECNKLGIRTITLLDTNCDPTLTELLIPANDDSIRSVDLLLSELSQAIIRGKA